MQQPPKLRFAHLATRWSVSVLTLVVLWSANPRARAQNAPPTDAYTRYAIRHYGATDVSRMLAELLGNEVELFVDTRGNQVLARGGDQSQRILRRSIELIDQPNGQVGPARGATLKLYHCPPDQLTARLGALRSRHARDSSVRFAADPESSQLIVLGTSEAHEAIRNELAAGVGGPRSVGPAQPYAAESQTRFVALPQWHPSQVEPTLQRILGKRLTREAPSPRGAGELVVRDEVGTKVVLHIDARRGGIMVVGPDPLASEVARLILANGTIRMESPNVIRTVSLRKAALGKVQEAVDAYRRGNTTKAATPPRPRDSAGGRAQGVLVAQVPAASDTPPVGNAQGGGSNNADQTRERLRELGLDLDIETLPDLDAIILRGNNRDVNEVLRIIEDIERLSAETVPTIEVVPLQFVGGEALAPMLNLVQKDLLAGRPGRVVVTPLAKPNALLLIGWGEAINSVKDLIAKLDQPVDPDTQVRVFRLRHAPAAAAATTVQEFFAKRPGLGPKVLVTPDARSNSLFVQASPRDMAEVEIVVSRMDTSRSEAVNQVRVFKLKNSLAANLATTLQSAIDSQRAGQTGAAAGKSHALELLTVDALGERIIKSGILGDVKVTPDARANTLIVSAPAETMELLAALIHQLDDSPVSVAQIKVFHIVNGDAASLVTMLRALLPPQTTGTAGTPLAKAEGEESFAPLRYSVETRTNSIIASGAAGDLAIIEALLLRLDEKDVQQRKNTVYRLKNEPANDIALAINDFLRSERTVQQAAPGTISPFQQIESEVVVVPEPVGNSLIISATPRFYDEIIRLVEKLDSQPPQVLIQVLIAEVQLDDTTQFGIELGLQDSVLFDRSLLGTPIFQNTTTTFGNPPTTTQTQSVLSATNTPGFDFNGNPLPDLGNSGSAKSLATAAHTAGQAVSNFAVGRTGDLGFGGLVLSASSKGISALLRALQQNQRLDVLSRPQVMTMDNQPAYIQVGQKVPRVVSASLTQFGQTTSTDLYDVGLILGVTPRISPDGMVVMDIDAIKSELGAEKDGIPIAVSVTGNVLRSPKINITEAHTTVSSANGETIILGGLITKSEQRIKRRVPYLSDVPILGSAFRYDQFVGRRTELLIILTPQVVRSAEDAQRLRQTEAARMHWCAADVHAMHGVGEFCTRAECPICDSKTPVIYPDLNPRGTQPTPAAGSALPILPNGEAEELPDGAAQRGPRKTQATAARQRRNLAPEIQPSQHPDVQTSIYYNAPPSMTPAGRPLRTTAPPEQSGSAAAEGKPRTSFDPARAIAYPDSQTSFSSR